MEKDTILFITVICAILLANVYVWYTGGVEALTSSAIVSVIFVIVLMIILKIDPGYIENNWAILAFAAGVVVLVWYTYRNSGVAAIKWEAMASNFIWLGSGTPPDEGAENGGETGGDSNDLGTIPSDSGDGGDGGNVGGETGGIGGMNPPMEIGKTGGPGAGDAAGGLGGMKPGGVGTTAGGLGGLGGMPPTPGRNDPNNINNPMTPGGRYGGIGTPGRPIMRQSPIGKEQPAPPTQERTGRPADDATFAQQQRVLAEGGFKPGVRFTAQGRDVRQPKRTLPPGGNRQEQDGQKRLNMGIFQSPTTTTQ